MDNLMNNLNEHQFKINRYEEIFTPAIKIATNTTVGRPRAEGEDELKLISIRLRTGDINFINSFIGRGLGTKIRSLISEVKDFRHQRKDQCEFIRVYLNQFIRCYDKYKIMVMRKDLYQSDELHKELLGLETLIKHSLKTLRLKNLDELEPYFDEKEFKLINGFWIN